MFMLNMTSGMSRVIFGEVTRCVYVCKGRVGAWMMHRRQAGLVVSLMSELDKEGSTFLLLFA